MSSNEIGSANITPRELYAILALLEEVIDLGVCDEQGKEMFSPKEVAALYAKLAATEDAVDTALTKDKRAYRCKTCDRPTSHENGYCSNDEYQDCGSSSDEYAERLREAYCGG